jgi:hypothetical protein
MLRLHLGMTELDERRKDARRDSRIPPAALTTSSFHGLSMSDGEPVKDWNDLLKISTDSYRENAKAINGYMRLTGDLLPNYRILVAPKWAALFGLSVTSIANAEKNGQKCYHPSKRLTMISRDDILAYFLGYGF